MELGVGDRLILLSILPDKADITALRAIREIREELSFDEAEHQELGLEVEEAVVKWNGKQLFKDIEFSDVISKIIRNAFRNLNQKKELREEHIPLYEKFVEER